MVQIAPIALPYLMDLPASSRGSNVGWGGGPPLPKVRKKGSDRHAGWERTGEERKIQKIKPPTDKRICRHIRRGGHRTKTTQIDCRLGYVEHTRSHSKPCWATHAYYTLGFIADKPRPGDETAVLCMAETSRLIRLPCLPSIPKTVLPACVRSTYACGVVWCGCVWVGVVLPCLLLVVPSETAFVGMEWHHSGTHDESNDQPIGL